MNEDIWTCSNLMTAEKMEQDKNREQFEENDTVRVPWTRCAKQQRWTTCLAQLQDVFLSMRGSEVSGALQRRVNEIEVECFRSRRAWRRASYWAAPGRSADVITHQTLTRNNSWPLH